MNHECLHETQITDQSQKIAELEARADYKDKRIDELKQDMHEIKQSIDNLTKTVNNSIVNSIKDDKDLDNRVTSLETKIKTQEDIIKSYEEKARKDREEDRAKTNQHLTYITVGISVLVFVLTYIFK